MPGKNRTRRKLIKKKQRQRRRQKQAQQRDKLEAEEEAQKQKDPTYQKWLKQQAELEEEENLNRDRQQQDEEEQWLRREALAQRQFSLDAAKKRCEEEKLIRLREQQAQELALIKEQQRQRREETKRMAEKAAAEFESIMSIMDDYLNNPDEHKPPPLELQRMVETHPQERLCEFFTRTNCCRFGHTCTHNHRRPMLARILLIRHFFSHPLLKPSNSDDSLELTEHDLRESYDEFFNDAVPELEKFGKIINFRALRNTLDYLRGHVFVEYAQERHALKAFINLQGRYYACKQLNVEFSNLKAWRGAVCGLSLNRKCPKGYSCAYLHLFRNPNNLFNTDLEQTPTPRSGYITPAIKTPQNSSWNDNPVKGRNWRWSESPEVEVKKLKSLSNESKDPVNNSNDLEDGLNSFKSDHNVDSKRSSPRLTHDHKAGSPSSSNRTSGSKTNGHQSRQSSRVEHKTRKHSCSRSDGHKDHIVGSHERAHRSLSKGDEKRGRSGSRSKRRSILGKSSKSDENLIDDRRHSKRSSHSIKKNDYKSNRKSFTNGKKKKKNRSRSRSSTKDKRKGTTNCTTDKSRIIEPCLSPKSDQRCKRSHS